MSSVRTSLSYLYGQEIVSNTRDATVMGSLFNIIDALTMVLMSLYFRFVSKYWVPF
jgi:hypothetical protein